MSLFIKYAMMAFSGAAEKCNTTAFQTNNITRVNS